MHEDPLEIFKMIVSQKIRFPKVFDSAAKSLIRHLTDRDLTKRYGNLKKGVDDVKSHRFFSNTNFYDVITQKVQPSYVPTEDLKRKDNISREPGMPLKLLPEVNKKQNSEIAKGEDPFLTWF